MRAELAAIESGFGKLPDLAGNGYKIAYVNAAGTALTLSSSVTFDVSGNLLVPTATAGDSSTKAASTAFVSSASMAAGNMPVGGTTGQILRKASATDYDTVWGTGTGLTFLGSITPTAAANVDFLSTFSSTYDSYLIECIGLKPASNTTLALRVAIAGAASSANTYFYTTVNSTASTAATYAELCNGSNVLAAGIGINTSIIIKNANSSSGIKTISNRGEFQDAATPTYVVNACSAVFTTAGVLTGFRLFWSGGANFAAVGRVRVYGIANS